MNSSVSKDGGPVFLVLLLTEVEHSGHLGRKREVEAMCLYAAKCLLCSNCEWTEEEKSCDCDFFS